MSPSEIASTGDIVRTMSSADKDQVLEAMMRILKQHRSEILAANALDTSAFDPSDRAMYDRLVVDGKKIEAMVQSLDEVRQQSDPVGKILTETRRPNGLHIQNVAAPFGTILIIYESRPDVTIEAACLALKAGNRILLKGGKEARHTNRILVECWHQALLSCGQSIGWIQLLDLDRKATQAFLQSPDQPIDLIVPRGGDTLIAFVKQHATCPVLVSGRGNNFAYVHPSADWAMTLEVIRNAKTDKISACNALDKVLLDHNLPECQQRLADLITQLQQWGVEVWLGPAAAEKLDGQANECHVIRDDAVWAEEFLAMKIVVGLCDGLAEAVQRINRYSGGHSVTILAQDQTDAETFLQAVDCAAVYHNASTRFTDGGQLGAGAELAISTDKLHHRGPLGLQQLVTNKYLIRGNGQVR